MWRLHEGDDRCNTSYKVPVPNEEPTAVSCLNCIPTGAASSSRGASPDAADTIYFSRLDHSSGPRVLDKLSMPGSKV